MRGCHARSKTLIAAIRQEGFTLDALLWSMLGAIINIYQGFRFLSEHPAERRCFR